MNEWIEETCNIAKINTILDEYEIEVDSPDGWVPVVGYVDKGLWSEYKLFANNTTVRCNENHLFETTLGWMTAKDLEWYNRTHNTNLHVLTKDGFKPSQIEKINSKIPIVDIQIDHPNHRYYTNGVSSHNTGVGKTLAMCHFAASFLSQGYNVLYITLEMAEEKIAERIDANLLNVDIKDLENLPKDIYDKKVERIKEATKSKLIIKEYPTASASVIHFRNLLNELNLKRNFKPDIIVVDYLNICASARVKPSGNINSYMYIKMIAEELRGLAVEQNVPLISATQTTRSGYENSDPDLTDTSESFGLPATADFMFALISTEQLEGLNQIMVKQLKNRYNDPTVNKRFVVGIDRAKMKLYDVEASAQTDLADSGQTPVMDKTPFGKKNINYNKFKGLNT